MPAPSPVHGIAAGGAAMREVTRISSACLTTSCEAVRLSVGDEAEPAGVVLEARVVQTLRGGSPMMLKSTVRDALRYVSFL